jgi:hypothetical protein
MARFLWLAGDIQGTLRLIGKMMDAGIDGKRCNASFQSTLSNLPILHKK